MKAQPNKVISKLCRRRKTSFWGSDYFITPRLVNWIHGDGLQVVYLEPLDTRPDYYILRIDSQIDMNNSGKRAFCDEVLSSALDAIEEQYGSGCEKWEADNGRTYTRYNPFPALSCDCGESWGTLARLDTPDTRTDHQVRIDLKKFLRRSKISKGAARK